MPLPRESDILKYPNNIDYSDTTGEEKEYMSEFHYRDEKNEQYQDKIEELLSDMPSIVKTYERSIEGNTAPYTQLTYLRRINVFLQFLAENNPYFRDLGILKISWDDLGNLEAEDIEEFTHWIRNGHVGSRSKDKESSVNNYLSALNSLWDYGVTHGRITHNVIKDVKRAKKAKHEVVRLDEDDKAGMINTIRNGTGLTKKQQSYRNDANTARDYALCLLMMRTGLRVSEAVSLNLGDVDFDHCFVHVMRKESKPDNVYFSDEVKMALEDYLELRKLLVDTHEDKKTAPLFVVSIGKYKGQRLSVSSVERLVKKYAMTGAPKIGDRITPHKLRSTFATDMILKTGDLSLVQAEMNHESPATTALYIDRRAQKLEEHRNDLDDKS